MNGDILSLVMVTVGFLGLVIWVYHPKNAKSMERRGQIPFDSQDES